MMTKPCSSPFQFWLEAAGLPVATYPSAVAYLADGKAAPRCLILDQNMPQMTGIELVETLRTRGITVPVLLISSAVSPALVARATAVGIARVLEKPPAEDELLAFVAASSGDDGPRTPSLLQDR